jgi:hypothetical protein
MFLPLNIISKSVTRKRGKTAEASKQIDALDRQLATSAQKFKGQESGKMEVLLRSQKAVNDATKALRDKLKAEEAEEVSMGRMRIKLSKLTAAYDKAEVRTKEHEKEINALSREIGKAVEATNRH